MLRKGERRVRKMDWTIVSLPMGVEFKQNKLNNYRGQTQLGELGSVLV